MGGRLSHAAILARYMNKVTVVGLTSMTARSDGIVIDEVKLDNGECIKIDGNNVLEVLLAHNTGIAEGWVGVTTYMGTEGELRVKKEVLVAMSGINTATNGFGEAIIYPTQEG